MQKLDAIVAATGAVVLVVAIAGAALYGGSSAMDTFQITFTTKEKDVEAQEGAATGAGFTATFNLTDLNITQVKVVVTFTGAAARVAAAPWTVQVDGPGSFDDEAQGSLTGAPNPSASVTVEIPINVTGTPADHAYEASSLDAAQAHARTLSTTNGTGTWTITARASPQVPPNEAITAQVALVLTLFDASATREVPASR